MDMHEHNHADHGSMDHDAHGSVVRDAEGHYFYTHGAFLGHIVPGSFFMIWGIWWFVATYDAYLTSLILNKKFKARAWYFAFFGPQWLRRIPLEPLIKIVLPAIGVLGELWLGHESWRTLIAQDGKFVVDNINDWQHSTMYLAFIMSGVMDLIGFYSTLPAGTELGFLSLGFLAQGVLLVFHLKGPPIEVIVHLILVLQIFATFVVMMFEAARPNNIIAASLRPLLTTLQGLWWIQTAYIMFTSNPAYDPDYMGGTMMAPAVFIFHMLWLSGAGMILLLFMRSLYTRMHGREISFISRHGEYRHVLDGISDTDIEMSGIAK